MRLINKQNFISLVCIAFTAMTLIKITFESIFMNNFAAFQMQLLQILLVSVLIITILSQHHRIFSLPIFLAVIIQYASVILTMVLVVWVNGLFTPLASSAYKDMIISVSFFYVLISVVYYIFFYLESKRHNHILQKLKQSRKKM